MTGDNEHKGEHTALHLSDSHKSHKPAPIGLDVQKAYLQDVNSFPILSPEEECQLTKEYGNAKEIFTQVLKCLPCAFIQLIRQIQSEDSQYRITNYFSFSEWDNELEGNVRETFNLIAPTITGLHPEDMPPVPLDHHEQADVFWNMLLPLHPMHFLFKRAYECLQNPDWRKKVLLDDKTWNTCRTVLDKAKNTMEKTSTTLVERNLRLVISIANKYANYGVPIQDLIQEGNIGLMRSIERFNYQLGHRFSTYACYWIRQAITRSLTNHSRIIRMPANTISLLNQIKQCEQKMLNDTGEVPSPELIAASLNVSPAKVRALQEMAQQPISLHAIVSEDKILIETLADQNIPKPTENSDVEALKETIAKLLDTLTDREKKIICRHFGIGGLEPLTLTAISKEMGLSSERIRQLEVRALHKLRMPSAMKLLEGYLK